MTKKIRLKPPRARGITLAPPKLRSVDAEAALRGIGAEPFAPTDSRGSPMALAALRRGLLAALRSSGGRPALQGASRRQKIPMSDADWRALEGIAATMKAEGSNVTAGQVASQLLSEAIAACEGSPRQYAAAHEPAPLRVSEVAAGVSHRPVSNLRRNALKKAEEAGERRRRMSDRSIVDFPLRGLERLFSPPGIALVDKGAEQPTTCVALLGDAGGGKTTAATAIAHAIARDLGGVALYLTTELFSTELAHKLRFLGLEHAQVLREKNAAQARAGDLVSQHLALLRESVEPDRVEQQALEAAVELTQTPIPGGLPVRCVVIDAFPQSNHRGATSRRDEIVGMVQALEGRGISVVIVDEDGTLGDCVPFVADIVLEMRFERVSDGGELRRKISCRKSRYTRSLPGPHDTGADLGRLASRCLAEHTEENV